MKDEDATIDSAGGREAFRPAGRVGRYVIVDKIGEGGMGVVYSAFDDELDRHVALKLINPHGSATAAHSRLVREARTMAKLQHPNVVAVYDAQTVGESVYVAMEHVPGPDLRAWRAARPRTLAEILSVFVQAGRGLAAAHAAGIIHRDFKPANVLVGDDGRTRVADFGLAMALGAPMLEDEAGVVDDETSSRVTRSGELVGTPAYMSPEQHQREPATPLSDQFSFCVSLYEAVCGYRPRTIDELRHGRPPTDAPGAPAWLRTILLRGLATAPGDRYPTMDALLHELGRDPAARRRRWLVLGASVVTASALAWGALSFRSEPCGGAAGQLAGAWDDAQRARVRKAFLATGVPYAEASLRAATGVLDRYASTFAGAHAEACRATRVRGEQSEEALGRRMACLDQRRQSLAAIANVLAGADREIVDNAARAARALPDLGSCADVASLQSQLPPPQDPEAQARVAALRARMDEARALHDAGKYARALELAEAAAAAAKPLSFLPLQADAELLRGEVLDKVNRYPDAEEAFYEAVYAAEAARHERALAEAWIGLIWMVGVRAGRYDEVPRVVRMADAALQRQGDPPDLRARYWSYRGSVATAQRKPEDADVAYRKALAIIEATNGADDLKATDLRFNLGTVAIGRGRYAEALELFERALPAYRGAYGPDHPTTARAEHAVGNALVMLERNAEAAEAYARVAAVREKVLGPDHSDLANTLNGWGQALSSQGRYDEALEKLRRSLAIKEKTFGPDDPSVANTVANIGSCLLEKKDLAGARPWLERALAIRRKKWGEEHPDVVNSLSRLTELESSAGRYAEAVAYGTQGTRIGEKVLAAGHPELGTQWMRLGQAYLALGQAEKARTALGRAVEIYEQGGAPTARVAEARGLLARIK